MSRVVRFAKYDACGNDFVVVRESDVAERAPLELASLCDRRTGIGADGVLVVSGTSTTPRMRIVNADGSIPEMCGNGARAVAHFLREEGRPRDVVLETDAGPHLCHALEESGAGGVYEVEMRAPTFVPDEVPVRAKVPVIGEGWSAGGRVVRVTAVGMGNPHLVVFDDDAYANAETIGPALQRDERMVNGANVGLAKRGLDGSFVLRTWERGVGPTLACGTNACATVAAAVELGLARRDQAVRVEVPGGVLHVTVGAPGVRARLRGPARRVFEGEIAWPS